MKKKTSFVTEAKKWSSQTGNVAPWAILLFISVIFYVKHNEARQREKLVRQNASLSAFAQLPQGTAKPKAIKRKH